MITMHSARPAAAAILALALGTTTLFAQGTQTRTMRIEEGDIEGQPCEIPELGAIVAKKQGRLEVLFVMDPGMRSEAYRDVDLRAGDIIAMANGKKLESAEALQTFQDGLAAGDPVKFGIKRDKEMMIISYAKADPESLPKTKRIMMTADGHGQSSKVFQSESGVEGEVVMLMGSGIIAKAGEEGPIVGYLIPRAEKLDGNVTAAEGDRIVSLQGQKTESLDALSAAWDGIAVGDQVQLVLIHDGKKSTLTFEKPEPMEGGGAMMITK